MGKHPAQTKSQGADLLQPYLYRARNLIEQFFNEIKQCRRVATRYDKLAANYLAEFARRFTFCLKIGIMHPREPQRRESRPRPP